MTSPYSLRRLTPASSESLARSEEILMPEGPADCNYLAQRFCPLSSLYNSQCARRQKIGCSRVVYIVKSRNRLPQSGEPLQWSSTTRTAHSTSHSEGPISTA